MVILRKLSIVRGRLLRWLRAFALRSKRQCESGCCRT